MRGSAARAAARSPLVQLLLLPLLLCAALVAAEPSSGERLVYRVGDPSKDFSRHTFIKPRIYHGREKRQISTTRQEEGNHIHDLTIGYDIGDKEHVLDLRLNRELIPANFFIKYQHEGKHVVNKPSPKEVDLCQYVGVIRGIEDSWAALSTCHGLRGVVYDGTQMHYIQAGNESDIEAPHFLYQHKHLISNHTCGYEGHSHKSHSHHAPKNHSENADNLKFNENHDEFNRILRYKRSANSETKLRGPYNANKRSRYVELVIVVDNKEYKELGNLNKVHHHCKDIANIINSLYTPLNIFIALVGVVVWTDYDEISLSKKGDTTLTNFLHYRREKLVKDHPNDNAQLLTREEFEGGVVGKALKGPICTFEFSGGVAMDHSNVVGLVATTIAHEMGHNFGMEHDTDECQCPEEKCIMSPSSGNFSPTHWSSCSVEYLAVAFEHGMDYCLKNKPERLFDVPVCGNGFVEPGEQCDCGLSKNCKDNYCCNPATCMLYANATCATGECCDLKTCRPSVAGTLCRSADQECDLPEYCTGHSEFCPDDIFKMDTEVCDSGKAFCYHGSCKTRTDQCKILWGPSGESSNFKCYEMNKKGTRHGNCGYNKLKTQFFPCNDDDVHCGMLHCRHHNERLEFGMENVAILSHFFINNMGSIIPCRTAIVDLGLSQIDPGLVPDGAKCGDEKMCVNQKCMPIASLRLSSQAASDPSVVCPSDCSGRGVCNSLGHCHCFDGYGPPLCEYPGPGGSYDSGPASDPNAYKDWVMLLCIAASGIITMALVLAMLTYYSRHQAITCWQHSKSVSSKSSTKAGLQHRGPRGGASCLGLCSPSNSIPTTLSQTTPRFSPDDMSSSLLPSQSSSNENSQNSFFGHFKGFSLTPIKKQEESFGHQNQNFGIENEQSKPYVSSFTSPNKDNAVVSSTSGSSTVKNAVAKLNNTAQINGNKTNNFHTSMHSPNQGQKFPVRSAPPIPSVPTVTIKLPRSSSQAAESNKQSITLNRSATTVGEIIDKTNSIVEGVESSNNASMAPALPPSNSASRPIISNPILEASTCTAKELISPLKLSGNNMSAQKVPLRTAPAVPDNKSLTSNQRPLSSPNAVVNTVNVIDEQNNKKTKEGISLNRIASFLKQEKNDKEKSRNPVERSNSLPKNPNHQVKNIKTIDKGTLKTLQISNPILISEIDVPASAVPVVSDSDDLEDTSKMVVMRAQSMRGPTMPPKPNLPSFGSMRQPSGLKRPTSIPVANRPTSPPPPRPDVPPQLSNEVKKSFPQLPSLPGYQSPSSLNKPVMKFSKRPNDAKTPEYDDCITEGHAPLANISEETSPDNIYAVIEESPPVKKSLHEASNKLTHVSPNGDQFSPKQTKTGLSSASSESMGLLGEIVSEIQNRNLESIYSTSTLARKKKLEEEKRLQMNMSKNNDLEYNNDSCTYANTEGEYKSNESDYTNMSGSKSISSAASTTSSGYLNPAAVNVPIHLKLSHNVDNSKNNSLETNKEAEKKPSETYRPYSSALHRSIGPIAASYAKDKNNDNSVRPSTVKPAIQSLNSESIVAFKKNEVKIQPNAFQPKPSPGENNTITPKSLSPVTESTKGVTNLNNSQTNNPDVVSSCASTLKTHKSPDVINSNGNQPNPNPAKVSAVNQGVILKPSSMFQKPTFNGQKPPSVSKPPTKPPVKANAQDSSKTITRSAPPPPTSALKDRKKVVPPRPAPPKIMQQNGDKSGSNSSLSSSKSNSIEKNLSNISKISDGDKQKTFSKPSLVRKSSDGDVKVQTNNTSQPKLNITTKSNIANLQQKFEPAKSSSRSVQINSIKK